jgi:hypothetical protein
VRCEDVFFGRHAGVRDAVAQAALKHGDAPHTPAAVVWPRRSASGTVASVNTGELR